MKTKDTCQFVRSSRTLGKTSSRSVILVMVGSREEHLESETKSLVNEETSERYLSGHEGTIQELEVQEDWETVSSANSRNVAKV